MNHGAPELTLLDHAPETESFREDVLAGLTQANKQLPCKYLYDARGSRLFDRICTLEEYYPTRTELAIMEKHVDEMVACLGPNCLLIEYGSGSSLKTRMLLDHLPEPAGYVPIDISGEHLMRSASELAARYPGLSVSPVCADFTEAIELPSCDEPDARKVVYFPGSTIGNFDPADAEGFLERIAALCQSGGGLLIGVDLKKDPAVLERAYNDRHGVTAAFNLNLLARINRELDAGFQLERFRHKALYDARLGRVEMHLVSLREQVVCIDDVEIGFAEGENIHTECSYKYSLDEFRDLARAAGFEVRRAWVDDAQWFSVQYLLVR